VCAKKREKTKQQRNDTLQKRTKAASQILNFFLVSKADKSSSKNPVNPPN
jgi:hypothetical protein